MTSETRKCMCHLDHHRRLLTKIIARAIWIPMLQEAVKTSNESNWNPIHNYQIQGDLLLDGENKPWNVPSLIATLLIKRNMTRSQIQRVRWNSYPDTNPQNVAFWHPDMLKMIKQVRENPSRWTCPSSRACKKDPKPILIEHHFVPTWSRRTSTIHSAKIRKRWFANCVMWSYSSCAKLHQKNEVLTVFFIGIKELCTLTDYDWMQSLSWTSW